MAGQPFLLWPLGTRPRKRAMGFLTGSRFWTPDYNFQWKSAAAAAGTIVSHSTLQTSLISYWKLDEASSTRYDAHGFGNSAEFTAANSEYLSIADNASLDSGDVDYTWTAWIYLNSKSANMYAVSKANGSTDEYKILYEVSTDRLKFNIAGSALAAGTLGSPSTGTWYFVCAWHDSVGDTQNISINNSTTDSVAYAGGSPSGDSIFALGSYGAGNFMWNGLIDEVGFWKRVLTADERSSLYNSGDGKNYNRLTTAEKVSMVSYWKLDETSGTRNDTHGTNHLTDNNTVTSAGVLRGNNFTDNNTVTQATGIISSAGQFTAANSEYLSILDNTFISVGDIDFTWSMWVYLDTKPSQMGIMGKFNSSGTSEEYALDYIGDATDRITCRVYNGSTRTVLNADTFGSPPATTWFFVVYWYDATANTLNIQVNNGTVDSVANSTGSQNTAFALAFGRYGEYNGVYYNGRIDEAGFWKKVLTAQERTDLYNSGSGLAYN